MSVGAATSVQVGDVLVKIDGVLHENEGTYSGA
jgi:hypothetical protein